MKVKKRMTKLILPFDGKTPKIHESSFIAENTNIIGDVEIGEDSSIWYGCTLRADVNELRIGKRTNIQDGSVIHLATHGQGTYIGDDVSVGHMALLHACTLEDGAFVGMKAIVMDGARVETGAMVAAGAMVTPGKVVKAGSLWAGSPAKYFRDLTTADEEMLKWLVPHYMRLAKKHKQEATDFT